MVMFALAIIPGLNFTYSGHGGISWFFAPLCFPWAIVRMLIKIAKGSEASGLWYKRFFKITIPSYVVIALPLSWAAAASIHMTFGLPISTWAFFCRYGLALSVVVLHVIWSEFNPVRYLPSRLQDTRSRSWPAGRCILVSGGQ